VANKLGQKKPGLLGRAGKTSRWTTTNPETTTGLWNRRQNGLYWEKGLYWTTLSLSQTALKRKRLSNGTGTAIKLGEGPPEKGKVP